MKNKLFITILFTMIAICAFTLNVNASYYYDDFNTNTIDNYWISTNNPATAGAFIENNAMKCYHTNSVGGFITKEHFNANGNFLLEFDYTHNTSTAATIFARIQNNTSGNYAYFSWLSSGTIYITYFNGNAHTSSVGTLVMNDGQTYHIEFYRISGTFYLDIDGVNRKTYAYSGDISTDAEIKITRQSNYANGGQYGLIDNLYYSSTGEPYTPNANITFNGYCKDVNNNTLQYCNVTLWDYSIPIASNITDANGYYNFTHLINASYAGYTLTVKPPNQGFSNAVSYAANISINPYSLNFTVAPVTLTIIASDKYNNGKDINPINVTINKNNEGNITYSNVNNPYVYPLTLNASDDIQVYVNAFGYFNNTTHLESLSSGNNYAHVPLSQNNNDGASLSIIGYTMDNAGIRIPNLDVYLVNATTNATIDHSVSNTWGYYVLKTNSALNPYDYKIIVNYPSYGNLTAHLHHSSSQLDYLNDMLSYPSTWSGSHEDLGVDCLLSLTYTPIPTSTPIPYTPPNGYYAINGYVKDINNSATRISNVPIYLLFQNGTVLTSTVSDASGNYNLIFAKDFDAQSLQLKVGNVAGYSNSTVGSFYIPYPTVYTSNDITTITMIVWLKADSSYASYNIYGYVKDDSSIHKVIGNVKVELKYSNGTVISTTYTNGAGYYTVNVPSYAPSVYFNETVGISFFNLTYSVNGYTTKDIPFAYPDVFLNSGNTFAYNVYLTSLISNPDLSELRITVYDDLTDLKIQNAVVKVYNSTNNTLTASGYTDSSGYILFDIPVGNYVIIVSKTGYVESNYPIEAHAGIIQIEFPMVAYNAPTAIPTLSPTPTPNNPYGNSFAAIIYTLFQKLGVEEKYMNEAISAGIIIFFAALGGSLIAKWEVILAFAFFGFIICIYAGLLEIWLLVVVILFIAGIIAIKFGGGL